MRLDLRFRCLSTDHIEDWKDGQSLISHDRDDGVSNGLEGAEIGHWFRSTKKLSYQEVSVSNHSTTAFSQPEEEVVAQAACQEEDILSEIHVECDEIKSAAWL